MDWRRRREILKGLKRVKIAKRRYRNFWKKKITVSQKEGLQIIRKWVYFPKVCQKSKLPLFCSILTRNWNHQRIKYFQWEEINNWRNHQKKYLHVTIWVQFGVIHEFKEWSISKTVNGKYLETLDSNCIDAEIFRKNWNFTQGLQAYEYHDWQWKESEVYRLGKLLFEVWQWPG